MEQEKFLRSATAWQMKHRPVRRLGDGIEGYLTEYVEASARVEPVVRAFMELLPAGLRGFCFVERYRQGVLYVSAQPGVYMHELNMMRTELAEQLSRQGGKVRVKEIRIVSGKQF